MGKELFSYVGKPISVAMTIPTQNIDLPVTWLIQNVFGNVPTTVARKGSDILPPE
jgi:hypothetical protein